MYVRTTFMEDNKKTEKQQQQKQQQQQQLTMMLGFNQAPRGIIWSAVPLPRFIVFGLKLG